MAKIRVTRRRRSFLGNVFVWLRNLAIVAAVLFFGAKFYADYKLDKTLEQAAGFAAPFGTLTVRDSYTGFNGDVGVEGVSFIPDPGLDMPPIILRAAKLHTPGFLWAIGLRGKQRVPDSMGLSLEGLNVDQSGLFNNDEGGNSVSGIPQEAMACGDVTAFETIDLNKMGFANLDVGLSGRYRIRPPDEIEFQLVVQVADASEIHVDLNTVSPDLMNFTLGQSNAALAIKSLSVALHASEFNRRRNSYCAGQTEVSEAQFLDNHMTAIESDMVNRGYSVESRLLEQYRQFARGDGVWTFKGRPSRPLPLAMLQVSDPTDLIDMLDISAALGSDVPKRINIYRVATDEDGNISSSEPELDASGKQIFRTRPAGKQPHWLAVDRTQLHLYIQRDARVTTVFGKRYSGQLLGLADNQLSIRTQLTGGTATVPISLEQIKEVKIRMPE